jgi:glycosyltransferase involved in cell wall biosynthesis
MRILLFDWAHAGHHENHVRRFADALDEGHEVIVAVPDELAARLGDLPASCLALGPAPPVVDTTRFLSLAARRAARRELALFCRAIAEARPDHAIGLYGDGLVRPLATAPAVGAQTSLSIFRPRWHYPELYGARQPMRHRLAARAFEGALDRWRRRPEAHAVFTLDEGAAAGWSRRRGAPAYALPEPLLNTPRKQIALEQRSGCVVVGALAARKGVELLARAMALAPTNVRVVLAGAVEPGYEVTLRESVETMRRAGAEVDLRPRWQSDAEVVDLLAGARCAVLPYLQHYGMSGVLAEAAAVSTPAVVHDWGLLGHEVRRHGLGEAVDCTDAAALRRVVLRFTQHPDEAGRRADDLARYAKRFTPERFREVVRAPFAE